MPPLNAGAADIRSMVLLGDRSGMPLGGMPSAHLGSLVRACWAHQPDQRPHMDALLCRHPFVRAHDAAA